MSTGDPELRRADELLASAAGRRFLADRGVVCDPEAFRVRLARPRHPDLAALAGLPGDAPVVYVAHQLMADYRGSVVAKLRAARDLQAAGVAAVAVWLDTDRAGADRTSMGVTWPGRRHQAARLAPRRLGDRETRFVPVGPDDVARMLGQLRVWVSNTLRGPARERGLARLDTLAADLGSARPENLADANLVVTRRLLRDAVGADLPDVLASRVADSPNFRAALDAVLTAREAVIAAFNAAVEHVRAAGVDPKVATLADDHLPLHYSCPRAGARLRLRHERSGGGSFAVAACRCGTEHRFHLGRRRLGVGELAATGRWSTDVTLPVYLDGLASGVVAGRSSALYGLVLGAVVNEVLGCRPVPALLPAPTTGAVAGDSLLYDHLVSP